MEMVCRKCGMVASLAMLRALLDERVHGCARCFCGGIEWDFKDGTVPTEDRIVQLDREVNG